MNKEKILTTWWHFHDIIVLIALGICTVTLLKLITKPKAIDPDRMRYFLFVVNVREVDSPASTSIIDNLWSAHKGYPSYTYLDSAVKSYMPKNASCYATITICNVQEYDSIDYYQFVGKFNGYPAPSHHEECCKLCPITGLSFTSWNFKAGPLYYNKIKDTLNFKPIR